MNNKHIGCVLVLLVAFVMTSCGGDTNDSSDSGQAAEAPRPKPTDSEPPEPTPSGTLATGPVPCNKFSYPAGFKQADAAPPVLCAFESSDARVSVTVGAGPVTFEQLRAFEESTAKSNGDTPPRARRSHGRRVELRSHLARGRRLQPDRPLPRGLGREGADLQGWCAGREGRRHHPGRLLRRRPRRPLHARGLMLRTLLGSLATPGLGLAVLVVTATASTPRTAHVNTSRSAVGTSSR